MTSKEFIEQQIAAGYKIHFNEGVYWQRVAPFFYKPVLHLEEIVPGKSHPKLVKSFFGYSHLVSNKQSANKNWFVMLLSHEKLKEFNIKSLSSSKRARVRKGLKLTEVKKIENIEYEIEDLKNICISTAIRTKAGKPPEYYTKSYNKWREWITKEFALPKREWWGSYCKGMLIAYFYSVQINDTIFIFAAKSHTDFLNKCPNDALFYTFLDYCKNLETCRQVIFGDWGKNTPTLNEFKQKYGFEKVCLPMYAKYNPLVHIMKNR